MLPSIAASSSGHWNQDGSRRWQRAIAAVRSKAHPREDVAAEAFDQGETLRRLTSRRPPNIGANGASRQTVEDLLDQRQRLGDLVDAHPHAGIHVAFLPDSHIEAQVAVRSVARLLAGVEGAARGAADVAAGAVLAGQLPRQDAGGDGAVLQRGGAVVELDQLGEAAADGADEGRQPLRTRLGKVDSGAARHYAVHHQAVAEAGVGDAQDVLAQDAAVGVNEREGSVVADCADVAEVVGEALELGHQRAQEDCSRRRLETKR